MRQSHAGFRQLAAAFAAVAKFASRLATASSSGKPVRLRLDHESGHGQGSARAQLQERTVDIYSFVFWQFGEPGFQPQPKVEAAAR